MTAVVHYRSCSGRPALSDTLEGRRKGAREGIDGDMSGYVRDKIMQV